LDNAGNKLLPFGQKSLSISWSISLHIAGIGTLLCMTVLLSLLPFQYGRIEQDAIFEARVLAEAVATIYQRLGDNEPRDHARHLLLRVARTPHVALVNVNDHKGFVRYSTDSRELGRQYSIRYGIMREENFLTITHLALDPNASIGSVQVVIDRDLMLVDTNRLFAQVALGLLAVIFILSLLVKGLVEKLVSARLAKLMNMIESAELGSFLIRAPIDRDDEIGHVVKGFNQLLGVITQIQASFLEREHNLVDAEVQKSMRLQLEETLFQLERSNERLKRKVQAQELLMEAAHRLGQTLKREAVVERLTTLVQAKLSWPHFMLFLIDNHNHDRKTLSLAANFGFSKEELPAHHKLALGEGICGLVAQTGAPVILSNLENEQRLTLWEHGPIVQKNGSLMAVPMLHKGRVSGVFLFIHPHINIFDADDVALISALGAQTALAIVNAELYETTLELATIDPLTGVMNRRAMVRQIEYELARAQRFNTSLALLLVDVDHFKSYNDRMGHVLGDEALKAIAQSLKENIRKVDSIARFGGEEFSVILPQANHKAVCEVAAKLCEAVRKLKLRGVEKQELGHLSISIGITVIPGSAEVLEADHAVMDIIAAADQALYDAKRLGRDRFIINESKW
jgi:diguanylate cyclase (GGDEF)-like protein